MPLSVGEIIGIVGILASVGFFFLGFRLGRKNSREQLELIVKALNIDRVLDGRDTNDEKLIIEEDTVKGVKTVTASLTIKANLIDIYNKKYISENGNRQLTDKELRDMGKNPKYWRAPCS